MDLIKKYMLKIVSFCAFLDIIDKKWAFYMENNQKKLNYSAKKVLTVGGMQLLDAAWRIWSKFSTRKTNSSPIWTAVWVREMGDEYSQNNWIQRET